MPDQLRFTNEQAANLANWNDRVAGHIAPDGYDVAGLLADPERPVAECDFLDWKFFSWMEADGDVFRLPADERDRVPLQFSIEAAKPAA